MHSVSLLNMSSTAGLTFTSGHISVLRKFKCIAEECRVVKICSKTATSVILT